MSTLRSLICRDVFSLRSFHSVIHHIDTCPNHPKDKKNYTFILKIVIYKNKTTGTLKQIRINANGVGAISIYTLVLLD